MENENNSTSFTDSPASKKRKLPTDNDENHNDKLQNEILKLKQMVTDREKTICKQAMTITRLEDEKENWVISANNAEDAKLKAFKEELRLKNVEMENELQKHKNELVELKNEQVKYEKQKDAAQKKIKELEEQLSFAKDVKSEPELHQQKGDEMKALKDKINELQSACDEYAKKIKELEEQVSSAKDVKPDPDCIDDGNAKQDIINELQSVCYDHTKKIKELEAQIQAKADAETILRAKFAEMKQLKNGKTKLLQDEIDNLKASGAERDKKMKDMEATIEAEKKNAADLQFELDEMQKCYKDDLKKNNELKDKYDNEVTDLKAEIDRLKQINVEFSISERENAALQNLNQIDQLNDVVTAAKTKEIELQLKIEEFQHNELEANEIIVKLKKRIYDLQTELKQKEKNRNVHSIYIPLPKRGYVSNESAGVNAESLQIFRQTNLSTVLKIQKLEFVDSCHCGYNLKIYFENQSIALNLSDCLRSNLQLQIYDEFIWDNDYVQKMEKVISLIHSCNLTKLDLKNGDISYNDFMKLVSSHTITWYQSGYIKNETDRVIKIHEAMKELPNIESFEIKCRNVTKTDCKKLAELETFNNLQQFKLLLKFSSADLVALADFIKKHQNAEFTFEKGVNRHKNNFAEKIKSLRELVPSNCKIRYTPRF